MRIEIIDIDPAQARQWLGLNTNNRKLRRSLVQTYALDMKEGRWHITGDTIKLDGDRLLDGQHRLAGIVEASIPVTMAVAFDVDRQSQDVLDIGAPRFVRDILELRGIENASIVAAVTRLVLSWERGGRWGLGGGASMSRIAMAERVDDRIRASASRAAGHNNVITATSPRIVGFCHWLFTGKDRAAGETFMERLLSGSDTQSAIHLLRERLLKEHMERAPGRGQQTTGYVVALNISGWNAWRRRDSAMRIQLPKGNEFPEPI